MKNLLLRLVIILCCCWTGWLQPVFSQTRIFGTVSDATTGEGLPGANISIEGTSFGTVAETDGSYELLVSAGEEGLTMVASFTGYESQKTRITLANGDMEVNFRLSAGLRFGEVVVTAQKREQRLLDLPAAVQAISGSTLAALGARDLNEVISLVPGASEGPANNVGGRQYQLRGVVQQNGDPAVGYYLDDAAFNFFGATLAPVSRSFDIARVEILRGPQSTLYGAGAMGGVIRYITQDPLADKISGNFVTGASTTNGGKPGYYGDAMINLPIVKNKLALRASGSIEHVGGYMESVDGQDEDINDADINQFRVALLYTPNTRFQFKLLHQANRADQIAGTFMSSVDPPVSNSRASDFVNIGWQISAITLSYDFDFATLTSTTNRTGFEFNNFISLPFPPSPSGSLDISVDLSTTAWNHETRLSSNKPSPFQWLLGTYYLDSDADVISRYLPANIIPDGDANRYSKALSFFGEFSYALLEEKLTLLAGLRTFNDNRGITLSANNPATEAKFSSINPRFNLAFRPDKQSNYFINIAKGFRSGQFNNPALLPLFESFGLKIQPNIDSDQLWSYELGTRQQAADGQINFEVIAYFQSWQNQQFSPAIQGITTQVTLGDSHIPGLDFGFAYHPKNSPVHFQLMGNFNGARFAKINPDYASSIAFKEGDRLPSVPAWNIGMQVSYEAPIKDSEWNAAGNLAFTHTDKQIGIDALKTTSDPQSLLRARFGISKNKFGISIFGNNLLGEQGALFATRPAPNAPGLFTQAFPRQIGLELKAGF